MKKRLFVVAISFALLLPCAACKKEEPVPSPVQQSQGQFASGPLQSVPPGQMPPGQMPPGQMPPGQMMQRGKTQVLVPDSVKGQWSGAMLVIEDKVSKSKKEYKVKLHNDFAVPDTNLKIQVGDFLPDFKMDGQNLTSGSNQPNNPALSIRVLENDQQIFPAPGRQWGWLFAKVPSIHPFEHPRYGIILKEGLKKG